MEKLKSLEEYLINIKSRILTCTRCGYRWLRKSKTKLPKNCPKCVSPYWNKLKREKRISIEF